MVPTAQTFRDTRTLCDGIIVRKRVFFSLITFSVFLVQSLDMRFTHTRYVGGVNGWVYTLNVRRRTRRRDLLYEYLEEKKTAQVQTRSKEYSEIVLKKIIGPTTTALHTRYRQRRI